MNGIKTNKKRFLKILFLFPGFLIIFFSCNRKPPIEPINYRKSKGILICNEGNFTYGNASLSFYEPETKKVDNQVFYNTNDFPLGDVFMSAAIKDSTGFLVINNSGKILIINTSTFKHIATISGLTSPRYIQFISNTKCYVTDLYNRNITIINPETYEITGSVQIGNGTEQIVKYNNFVFVCGWSYNNKVYKISTQTDKLIDSLTVTKQPNSIVLDTNNKLWVLSDGGFPGIPGGQETPALTKIDAETFSVEKILIFPSSESSPTRLSINGTKDTLYFLNGTWANDNNTTYGIYRMPVNAENLPLTSFISQKNRLFYGLGIDPATSDIYVSDAIDYMQKGIIYRYRPDKTLVDSFKADIIPSYFCFLP